MKIISIKTLRAFWAEHPDAEQPLKAWVDEASKAAWKTPAEIKDQYRNASILKNRRVVFNIKGNDYRLIVSIAYQRGWMFIKFIGTHKEYDKIDAETIGLE
ncbi:type II toxin-antitoxin system HigB family toxin [Salmonella enterica]|nr:type II toxin-antitoxin system HigB family toxin [Salmonella enterica]